MIARTTDCISTFGADTLTIDAPVHYSGSTTNGTYYKWSVQWYCGNTSLGLASEQSNFATVTEYTVPAAADRFRIKIASVVDGTTESQFPLSTFINDGGLNVWLSGVTKTVTTLTEWELGSFAPSTGIENSLTRIARTTECILVQGASELHIVPLVHYSGVTTSDTYYKWRVVWFDGDICLGIAGEQADFSTETDFVVPEGADRFRLTVASVVDGITEDPFPLDTFLGNGGMVINLISTSQSTE